MITTQQIKSTTTKPVSLDTYETINVLKWNNCKWKKLCPYLLKTDGEEFCHNSGGILFENFYQGCKVYDVVYENEVYPSRYYMNNPKYLWWKLEYGKHQSEAEVDIINMLSSYVCMVRYCVGCILTI